MLARYIKDLLYRNESVIIPNFGAITSEIVSAKIDEENNSFIPPSKVLKFDSSLTENDGLLSEYIAKVENSSIEIAENFIKFETDEWKEKIENGDLDIENIGTFTLDSLGNIQFEQSEKSKLFVENFGLEEVDLPETLRDVPDNFIEEKKIKQPSKKSNKKKEKKEKSSWINVLIYGLLFLFLGAFGWFFTQTIIENNERVKAAQAGLDKQDELIKQTMNDAIFEINQALPTLNFKYINNVEIDTLFPIESIIDSTRVKSQLNNKPSNKDTLKTNVISLKENAEANDTSQETNVTPTTENRNQIAENARKFWVIEGVYKDPGNAINRVRELIQKGFKGARIVPKESSNTYVAYAMFSTYEEATRELQNVKKSNSEAWILGN